MTKYRNGKKKRSGPYDATKKVTKDDDGTPEEFADQASENECQNCKADSDTLVQCEKCKLWLCCDCQSISPNMLKAIKQFKSLHWFCKTCEANIQEILQSESTHPKDNVECRLQTMENQLAKLTSNISDLTSNWEGRKVPWNCNILETRSESLGQMA